MELTWTWPGPDLDLTWTRAWQFFEILEDSKKAGFLPKMLLSVKYPSNALWDLMIFGIKLPPPPTHLKMCFPNSEYWLNMKSLEQIRVQNLGLYPHYLWLFKSYLPVIKEQFQFHNHLVHHVKVRSCVLRAPHARTLNMVKKILGNLVNGIN